MKFSVWTQNGALNSSQVFTAFKTGAISLGHSVSENTNNADVDVIWSVLWRGRMAGNREIYNRATQSNRPVIVLEVGGIQRNHTWKVGINGVNRSSFAYHDLDPARPEQLGLSLNPWQPTGKNILICGQHQHSLQWETQPPTAVWLKQTVEKIRTHTSRPIVFRPHPRWPIAVPNISGLSIDRPVKIPNSYDDYQLKFENVHAVVNWSSNPAIHAIVNGVPAFTGPTSIAAPVANLDLSTIENPLRPDRSQWLIEYAHTEWTVDEIAQGIPIARLMPQLLAQLA